MSVWLIFHPDEIATLNYEYEEMGQFWQSEHSYVSTKLDIREGREADLSGDRD